MTEDTDLLLEGSDWPVFGWADDVRPALRAALDAGRSCVLATLYRFEGSAPRGAGAQMLFDGPRAAGYFSGDCIEADVALHAAEVAASGDPQWLHYGTGSPWIDIRLRCGGALHILVEPIAADSAEARALLDFADRRRACIWISDGADRRVDEGEGPLLAFSAAPRRIARRYDPPRRIIVTGGDPGALALARLAAEARFDTWLVRPGGPDGPPPFPGVNYLRADAAEAIARIGVDRWTAYVGATHEDHHDLGGCLAALRGGAGYVAMIGARSRAPARRGALEAAGASPGELARLHLSPGVAGLGKAPWEVATGIVAEVMRALNPGRDRA